MRHHSLILPIVTLVKRSVCNNPRAGLTHGDRGAVRGTVNEVQQALAADISAAARCDPLAKMKPIAQSSRAITDDDFGALRRRNNRRDIINAFASLCDRHVMSCKSREDTSSPPNQWSCLDGVDTPIQRQYLVSAQHARSIRMDDIVAGNVCSCDPPTVAHHGYHLIFKF